MEQKGIGLIILVFITLIVGLALISEVGSMIFSARNLGSVTNETVTIASSTGNLAQDDISAVSFFGNTTKSGTADLDTLVNWTKAGVITVSATNYSDTTYNISYTYEPDEYVVHGTARSLLTLILIFFAIGILAVGVSFAMKALKDI